MTITNLYLPWTAQHSDGPEGAIILDAIGRVVGQVTDFEVATVTVETMNALYVIHCYLRG